MMEYDKKDFSKRTYSELMDMMQTEIERRRLKQNVLERDKASGPDAYRSRQNVRVDHAAPARGIGPPAPKAGASSRKPHVAAPAPPKGKGGGKGKGRSRSPARPVPVLTIHATFTMPLVYDVRKGKTVGSRMQASQKRRKPNSRILANRQVLPGKGTREDGRNRAGPEMDVLDHRQVAEKARDAFASATN